MIGSIKVRLQPNNKQNEIWELTGENIGIAICSNREEPNKNINRSKRIQN